ELAGRALVLTTWPRLIQGFPTAPRGVFIFELGANGWEFSQELLGQSLPNGTFVENSLGADLAVLDESTIVVPEVIQIGPGSSDTEVNLLFFKNSSAGWVLDQYLPWYPTNHSIGWWGELDGAPGQLVISGGATGGFYLVEPDAQGIYGITAEVPNPEIITTNCQGFYNGYSVAVEGDLVVVGDPHPETITFPCPPVTGAINVYRRGPNGWFKEAKLRASDQYVGQSFLGYHPDQFGWAVDIDHGRILVGAPQAHPDPNDTSIRGTGQAYVFEYIGGAWQETSRLRRAVTGDYDQLGYEVALSEDTAWIGAPGAAAGSIPRAGAVQVYNLPMGVTVCSGTPNSTGDQATLEATGWRHIELGDFRLAALGVPAGQATLFLGARSQATIIQPGGSQGVLCLAGGIARFNRPGEYSLADSSGYATLHVPTLDIPENPSVALLSGETWYFQAWYRDQNPTPTSNFTQAIEVTFE
ncbi:MAG TPA: FG-GAP repeat protein, partial [Planctomycetota bacterium]|nr:FG-GAP repeat protein [Planctomycetota bacterium]